MVLSLTDCQYLPHHSGTPVAFSSHIFDFFPPHKPPFLLIHPSIASGSIRLAVHHLASVNVPIYKRLVFFLSILQWRSWISLIYSATIPLDFSDPLILKPLDQPVKLYKLFCVSLILDFSDLYFNPYGSPILFWPLSLVYLVYLLQLKGLPLKWQLFCVFFVDFLWVLFQFILIKTKLSWWRNIVGCFCLENTHTVDEIEAS